MISSLLIDANMNTCPDDSTSKNEPCTLSNSEKKLYNTIINSWNQRERQERFEAYIAMEKEVQAPKTAFRVRASDEEENYLRNDEVSGTAAHFAREMELRRRRAAAGERGQGQKRKRDGERSDCR